MVRGPKRDLPSVGASPSGKAPDFDSGIRRFESFRPSHPTLPRSFGQRATAQKAHGPAIEDVVCFIRRAMSAKGTHNIHMIAA